MYDAKGSVFGDLNAPNSPASVASRYFLAPQAKKLQVSRPKVPSSRHNGAPGSSTGKPKVAVLLERNKIVPLYYTCASGKAVVLHQGL